MTEVTEADEAATSKGRALMNLADQIAKRAAGLETQAVVDMYERAAINAGASVAECEALSTRLQ